MASLLSKANYKLIAMRYRGRGDRIVQTRYRGCPMLVRANEDVGQLIIAGIYETEDLGHLLENVQDRDVFVDVGANTGLFSLLCAHRFSSVDIHAFEPVPLNACLFESSIHLNGFENITLNRSCVGSSEGETELSLASDSAYSSIIATGRKPVVRRLRTRTITLDSYASRAGLRRIDILKVDVEGAEKLVLEGARGLLGDERTRPRLILVELFDQNLQPFGTSIAEIVELLAAHGYRGYVIDKRQRRSLMPSHYNEIYNVFFEVEKP